MKVLIATSKGPGKNFDTLCQAIRAGALQEGVHIPDGILWTDGLGCTNLAMELIGNDEDCKSVADAITIALMPAKWCTTPDPLPETDTNNLEA